MSAEIKNLLQGKKLLILGYGYEGQSTYKLLRSYFRDSMIGIADRNNQLLELHPELLKDENLELFTGDEYLDACSDYELVIKSPGIPYELLVSRCETEKISSQTDLFLQAYSSKVTGITGTKGKSTVTTLIYHIMQEAGRSVALSGNIGIPPFDLLKKIKKEQEIIFEMSSHQLEHISVAPSTAVILNIFPEHLDHYKDFTAYKMAKFNISNMQEAGGTLIYSADDPFLVELVSENHENQDLLSFSIDPETGADASLHNQFIEIKLDGEIFRVPVSVANDLPGRHNTANMMAAMLVCLKKGLGIEEIIKGLATYSRLPHRLEFAGTFSGIRFYNDSIATVPEATIEALRTLGKVDLLILGGFDRGLEYDKLFDELWSNPIPYLVFLGPAGKRMHEQLMPVISHKSNLYLVSGMEEAFGIIKDKLKKGDVCLLSPAAASYGMFINFEDRGDTFKKMAATL